MSGKAKKGVGAAKEHPPESSSTEIRPSAPSRPASGGSTSLVKKPKHQNPTYPQRFDPLWKALDSQIGGREGLLSVALASSNPKARDLVALLLDKAYKSAGTKHIAFKAGLSASEIVAMFKEKKGLEADLALYEALPEIIRGAADDAKPQFVPCDNCKGLPQEPVCYICEGRGKVRKPGDKDKIKFVGEAAGIVGKVAPQVEINNNQIIAQQQNSVSFEDLLRKATLNTSKVKVLDVEPEK